MLLIWSYKRSKSSWLETRNGCSNTKLLLADGWWYCKAPVSVLRRIKTKAKLTLKTVGWSAKIRLSCSREAKIIPILKSVAAAKSGTDLGPVLPVRLSNIFLRGRNKVWRNKNRISFPTGTRSCSGCLSGGLSSTRMSRLLRFFRSWCFIWSRSAAFTVICLLLLMSGADMKGARLWKFSPQVAEVNVRSAACLLWAFKCLFRFDFVWKLLSQRRHWWGFSPVWTRWWLSRWFGRVKVLPQVSQRCSLRGFLAAGSPTRIEFSTVSYYLVLV